MKNPFICQTGRRFKAKLFFTSYFDFYFSIAYSRAKRSTAQAGYKLTEIKAQVAVLEKENQTLRIDIAKLKSTERIEEIATHELGLVLPDTNI